MGPWYGPFSVCIKRTDILEGGAGAPSPLDSLLDFIPEGNFTVKELDSKNILQQLQGPQEDGEALACIVDNTGTVRWTAEGVTDDMFALHT